MASMQLKPLKKNRGVAGAAIRSSQRSWEMGKTQNQPEPSAAARPEPRDSSKPGAEQPWGSASAQGQPGCGTSLELGAELEALLVKKKDKVLTNGHFTSVNGS